MKYDIHNYNKRLEYALKNLDKDYKEKKISKHNYELLKKFDRDYSLSGVSVSRRQRIIGILDMITREYIKKNLDKLDADYVKDLIIKIDTEHDWTVWTRHTYKNALRTFFKWLEFKDEFMETHETPLLMRGIKIRPKKNEIPHVKRSDLYTEQEAIKKRYITKLLALIFSGDDTNRKLASRLDKDPSTIAQRLDYLKDIEFISIENKSNLKYNEIKYTVNLYNIIKYFLKKSFQKSKIKINIKQVSKNKIIQYSFKLFILYLFSQIDGNGKVKIYTVEGYRDKFPEDIILEDIFAGMLRFYIYSGHELNIGKNPGIIPINYPFDKDKKEEEELILLIKSIHEDFERQRNKDLEEGKRFSKAFQ